MKLRHLFLTVLAAAAFAAAGCDPEEPLGPASLTVDPPTLAFETAGGGVLTFTVTATRDWEVVATTVPDWITFSPSSGKASNDPQTVTVTAAANDGSDRSGEVTLYAGVLSGVLKITQPGNGSAGDGTLENPYTVAGALSYVGALAADTATETDIYIQGKVSEIGEQYGTQYGNGTFYISDDGSVTADSKGFYVFRALYLGNKKFTSGDTEIQVGDEVIICGKVVNYKGGTPETVTGQAYLYSLNGDTGPETPDPVEGTLADIIAAEDNAEVSTTSEVLVTALTTRGYMVTDGTDHIYVYTNSVPTVAIGDKVTFTGTKTTYPTTDGSSGVPEVTSPTTTTISSGNAVTYPEATDITATFDTYDSDKAVYVTYTATVEKSDYVNFLVSGATRKGSLTSITDATKNAVKSGDEVQVTGYYNGYDGKNNLINVVATDVKVLTAGKTFSVSTTALNVKADATSATFDIKSDVAWIVKSDNDAFTVSDASGEGDKTITVTFPANETAEKVTATVTVETEETAVPAQKLTVTITQAAKSSGDEEEGAPVTITCADVTWNTANNALSGTSGDYTISAVKNNGSNAPTYNANGKDVRAYAKNTLTIESSGKAMLKVVFNISAQGKKRLAPITASEGTIAEQSSGDGTVTWTGNATKVSFTVGEKAEYGSEGNSKAGQFDFDSIVVTPVN